MTHAFPDPDMQAEFYEDVPTKRLIAWLIDTVITLILSVVILPFTGFFGVFVFPLYITLIGFLYRWVTISQSSATWGMRLVAIKFRNKDGQSFDTATAFLHTAITTACFVLMFLPQLVSIALILSSPRRQSLADHILATVAINRAATS